jgi:hypothetical protein
MRRAFAEAQLTHGPESCARRNFEYDPEVADLRSEHGSPKDLKSSSTGRISRILVIAAVSYVVFAREAHAYLDPGSVSLFFQALVAGALGAVFLVKRFWTQIKTGAKDIFSGRSRNDET